MIVHGDRNGANGWCLSCEQDVFNLLPNLNVQELVKSFAGESLTELLIACQEALRAYSLKPLIRRQLVLSLAMLCKHLGFTYEFAALINGEV